MRQILAEISSDDLHCLFEHSKRTSTFCFKKPDMDIISPSLVCKLKSFKTTPRSFKGQRQRVIQVHMLHYFIFRSFQVIIFPEVMLTPSTIQALHDLSCRYDVWLKDAMVETTVEDNAYGEEFYRSVEMDR